MDASKRSAATGTCPARGRWSDADGAVVEIAGQKAARTDFIPVVILGVDPEDGHDGHTLIARDAGGECECRDGFEQGVDRAAEQACLLARDNGDRLQICKAIGRETGRLGRTAPLLLVADDLSYRAARARALAARGENLAPRLRACRIACKERREPRELARVVYGESSIPGKAARVDGQPHSAGGGSDTLRMHVKATLANGRALCQLTDEPCVNRWR